MALLIVLALAPVFIIAFYIYFRDKYEKEPWDLLLKAMLFGALITIPIALSENIVSAVSEFLPPLGKAAWDAFFVAALCEEGFKMTALFLFIWKNPAFNEKFDGIVYATFVSLGFAAVENILYVVDKGVSTGLVRALTAVPAHAIFGICMGYFLGMAKFYPKRRKKYFYQAFLLPFFLHGIYDFILMSGKNYLLILFIPFIVYIWITGFSRMKSLNKVSIYNTDIDIGIDFSKVDELRKNKNE